MPLPVYRIQCCVCPNTTDGNKGRGGQPKGWTIFWKIRSALDSYRMKPKRGEVGFDIKTHWQTHYGMCQPCTERMNAECRGMGDEGKAAWVNKNKKF